MGSQPSQVVTIDGTFGLPRDRADEGEPLSDRLTVGPDQVDLRVVAACPVGADHLCPLREHTMG